MDQSRGRELLIRLYEAGVRDRRHSAGEVDLCRTGADEAESLVAGDVRRDGYPRLLRLGRLALTENDVALGTDVSD